MTSLTDYTGARNENFLAKFVRVLKANHRAWRDEQHQRAVIARELYSYGERELFDLGIQSADIPAIINGTYRR